MTFLTTLLLSALMHLHPVHVSFTGIDIDSGNKQVSVSMKFYTDDFSLLFYHLYEKKVKPEMDTDFTPGELELINKYILGSFTLVAAGDTVALDFVRKDQEDLFVWLYYTSVLPSGYSNGLMLTNKLLLDLYEDQTNLVIFTDGKMEKGFSFTYKNWQKELLTL